MIDVIRDGVPSHSHRAVYNALVRTACSARQRGWSRPEWQALVEESRLGTQNRTRRDGRPVNPKHARERLWKAWDAAGTYLAEREAAWTPEQAREHVAHLANAVRDTIADADTDHSDNERRVLAYFADLAEKRGSDRLAISRDDMFLPGTGLGLTAWRTAMARLAARGDLTVVEPGTRRSKGRPKRATVYRLGPLTQWGNPVSSAPTHLVSSAPDPDGSVPPALVSSAPTEETDMDAALTLRLTPTEQGAVLRLLADLRAGQSDDDDAEVRHLRVVGEESSG